MAPSPSAQQPAAKRGSLSARQWQDIRQATRIVARSPKVTLTMHNVIISGGQQLGDRADRGGLHGSGQTQQQQQRRREPTQQQQQSTATVDASATEVSDSNSMEVEHATKRQLRDARRRAMHIPRRCRDVWRRFAQKARWTVRRQLLDDSFTTFMRTRLGPKQGAQRQLRSLAARARTHSLHRRARLLHRLRDLLWRAWTARLFALTTEWGQSLGMCSLRDRYIYERAAALAPKLIKLGLIRDRDGGNRRRGRTATRRDADDADISDARHPGGRTASARKAHEAGIPATPGSARARKRSGRR